MTFAKAKTSLCFSLFEIASGKLRVSPKTCNSELKILQYLYNSSEPDFFDYDHGDLKVLTYKK